MRPELPKLIAAPYSSVVGIPITKSGHHSDGIVAMVMPARDRGQADHMATLFVNAQDLEHALVDCLEAIDTSIPIAAVTERMRQAFAAANDVLKRTGRR